MKNKTSSYSLAVMVLLLALNAWSEEKSIPPASGKQLLKKITKIPDERYIDPADYIDGDQIIILDGYFRNHRLFHFHSQSHPDFQEYYATEADISAASKQAFGKSLSLDPMKYVRERVPITLKKDLRLHEPPPGVEVAH